MTDELKQWEYDRGYDKGKLDGAREFAEWLNARRCFGGWYKFDGDEEVKLTTDEILVEWQKGKENE